MSLGKAPKTEDVFKSSTQFCDDQLSPTSIYRLLHRDGHRLFPDEAFADLFTEIGRWSIPPQIVAVVMVLQRLEGLSDREAVDRMTFDLRWKYAAGGLDFDYPGFVHTVLVDMRARLRRSERPNRIFETALDVAREAGLIGRKRVLDSTPLYDAVATQDTVTLIRSAIRALFRIIDEPMRSTLRAVCKRDDDYTSPGKPSCAWNDPEAREVLVDALAGDAYALLAALDGKALSPDVLQAVQLLATVIGQDLERTEDGLFRIARRVAEDRVISTVDAESRHGHKTAARGFDGYKGHIAVDPDSEIITATTVSPGNAGDGGMARTLMNEVLPPEPRDPADARKDAADPPEAVLPPGGEQSPPKASTVIEIYGDGAYGTAELIEEIERTGAEANVKVPPAAGPAGMFPKDRFTIDLENHTVRCPAGATVEFRQNDNQTGFARFGVQCKACPLRDQCTSNKEGRTIRIHAHEATLQNARKRQSEQSWVERYRKTRPKVERKLAHLMSRRHGGRKARMRGRLRIGEDFALLGAAHNLKRMAKLGVHNEDGKWAC
jgi:Transposase DDE domain/Transposase domain (DUF772)